MIGRFIGDRTEHVICLVALRLQNRNTESLNHLADSFNLKPQIIGHFFTGGFVLGVEVIAKGATDIKGYGQILRLLLFKQAQQHRSEAIGASGRLSIAGDPAGPTADRAEREIGAVGQRVTINKEKPGFRGHVGRLPPADWNEPIVASAGGVSSTRTDPEIFAVDR